MNKELIVRCAGQFIPQSVDDFVGDNVVSRQSGDLTGARLVARQIEKAVRMANANGQSPLKFQFNGKPGMGKSALVQYLQHLTGCAYPTRVIRSWSLWAVVSSNKQTGFAGKTM
jgi:hypothetical protein